MNDAHLELLRSDLWRELLTDFIIPFALDDLTWADLGADVLECGPGPGLTTEVLRSAELNVTAIELDAALADHLQQRLPDVEVVHGDATAMPFETGRFSAVVCVTCSTTSRRWNYSTPCSGKCVACCGRAGSSLEATASPARSSRTCTTATSTTPSRRRR